MSDEVSNCCGAIMLLRGAPDETHYYVCAKCTKVCAGARRRFVEVALKTDTISRPELLEWLRWRVAEHTTNANECHGNDARLGFLGQVKAFESVITHIENL